MGPDSSIAGVRGATEAAPSNGAGRLVPGTQADPFQYRM